MYVTPIIETSADPLSDTTPTYIDRTVVLLEAEWEAGNKSELDDPEPGQATFRFTDGTRALEGANLPPLSRIRWRITSGATTYDEGIWYVSTNQASWPDEALNQEAVVSCADGTQLLSLDALPLLSPSDVTSYEEVINHDEPSFYYRLGEEQGTKLVARVRVIRRWKKRGRKGPRPGKRLETRPELAGVSGPSGTYKNLPTLAVPGLILGDTDRAVDFEFADSQYARVAVDQSDLIDTNRLSISAWTKPESIPGTTMALVAGPLAAAISNNVFILEVSGFSNSVAFTLFFTDGTSTTLDGTTTISAGSIYHIGATWDGQTMRLYVNGQPAGSTSPGAKKMRQGDAGSYLYIGRSEAGKYYDGVIDELSVFERVLTPERMLAHYQAGAERGFPQQTAGARVSALATSDLWAETKIQAGSFSVQPEMKYGQPPLEIIADAVAAEMPQSMFWFDGAGDPTYLGWEWKAGGSYNTVQATFGNQSGEVPYEDVEIVYDNEIYNEVTISHQTDFDGEASHTMMDEDSQAQFRRRAFEENLSLVEHIDAEAVAGDILQIFAQPVENRIASLTLSGIDAAARTQIFEREIGDLIRIKHRPKTGAPIDRITHILGFQKRLAPETGDLSCIWYLARGFDAAVQGWRAGIVGFSEAGTTTYAG
jgi:hypothetical protein